MDDRSEDPDRAAILARRQRFIALALSGLAVACGDDGKGPSPTPMPCLDVGQVTTSGVDDDGNTLGMTGQLDGSTTGGSEGPTTGSSDGGTTGGSDGTASGSSSSGGDAGSSSTGGSSETGEGSTGRPIPCLGVMP